jgi:arginine decarboxylase
VWIRAGRRGRRVAFFRATMPSAMMTRNWAQRSDPMRLWTIKDSMDTYGVASWGRDHFNINEQGNLTVGTAAATVDLKALVDDLAKRGIQMPLLIRFSGLLESRIRLLNEAFNQAIKEYGYGGQYRGVYPIKVNQSRKVVEAVTRYGREFHYGLEAGSKPELLATMAMLDDEEALVVCNGYKDDSYIETALLASRLRKAVIIVVEKPSELHLIKKVSSALGIKPAIGIRMRLSTRGAGKWEQSGGDHAKFGLSAAEILAAVDQLREWEMLDTVRLLHFHLGSQITAIRSVKDALREATRMYTELVQLGCNGLSHFDVGGGLGVDYDGSQTSFDSSMNYTVQEYANDVVWAVQEACDDAGIPHPTLVSESGRAVVAHHSVLVVNIIGVASPAEQEAVKQPPEDAHDITQNFWEVYSTVSRKNVRECYHDALEYRDQMLSLFNLGHLSLAERASCERLFWAICGRMAEIASGMTRVPSELGALERILSDTYFCNFSLFQSVPDAWAVDQLFPIMPIHRLNEKPTRRGILADITCDSDGTIDAFVDLRDVKDTLALHELPSEDEPYYVGIMLTGAYQEILGDMHNLFGDTNVVTVNLAEKEGYIIDEVVYGDTVTDVLRYVDYEPNLLINNLRMQVETAVRDSKMTLEESRHLMQRYRDGLASYTYLE